MQNRKIMTDKELLVEKIQHILEVDLNFLSRLSTDELRILGMSLEILIATYENNTYMTSCSSH